MKVLFMTNLPSPYRRLFFAELGKKCDLTVIYERKSARDRNKKWVAKKEETYNEIFLHSVKIGDDNSISFEILKHLSQKKYDVYVISTYNTFTSMIAISYLRAKKIAYYHSTDGGFISEESRIKYSIKKHFISSADKWLSTGANSTDYLCHYGAKREKVFVYPFTSLTEADIESAKGFTREDKFSLRKILGIREERVLLTVGRFSYQDGYGKGYDILLAAAERIDPQIGIYIVGDEPTDEFVRWKDERRLDNIHYVGFKEKDELTCYYVAADAFILLTRGDVWGLVINEAMSFGLPVITTYQCNAGEELIRDGENGYLIDAGDVVAAAKAIENVFSSEIGLIRMSKNAIVAVSKYSIENMSDVYMKVFTGGGVWRKILSIKEKYVVLGVGQFIHRKGFDVLLRAMQNIDEDIGLYLIGGEAPNEYTKITKELGLKNVHFLKFMSKEELMRYYLLSDVFVLPTREDIWGLVVNEALSCGTPVITTNRCGAGLELIRNGYNGYVISPDNVNEIKEKIISILATKGSMRNSCLKSINKYTVEQMAEKHIKVFNQNKISGKDML